MELKSGYKHSALGVVPEDWNVIHFSDIADKGKPWSIAGGPFGSNLKASEYVSEGVRIIQLQNIGDGQFKDDYEIFTSDAKANELLSSNIYPGEIILSKMGDPVARACFVPQNAPRYLMASDGIRLAINSRSFDSHFVLEYINSPYFRERAKAVSTGSTRQRISLTELKLLPFVRPSLSEQRAIGLALYDVDLLITKLDQLIAKKRDLKLATMQQLLTGNRRLPGFTGAWEMKRLGELAVIRTGGTPSTTKPQFWGGDILWCTPTDITGLNGFKYLDDTSRKLTQLGVISSSAEIVPANSVVMTSRATIGACAINRVPVSTNQGFKNFTPLDGVDVQFLYYLLGTQTQSFISLCGGSTFLEIGKSQLASFEVCVPPANSEQIAISKTLSDIDAEIVGLETRLAKTRLVKQGMMQELLTGKTRLLGA